VARAHIEMDFPTARTLMQKKPHCGEPTIPRGTPHVFAPGATITLRWHETVNHPGHYRVSFNPNGDTFGLPPTATDTTLGIDPLVLVDLIPDAASGAGTYSQDITLPNMECTNCTIQVIQLMTDKLPYSINYPDPAANDIYFQCIDVVLSASAPDANPGGGTARRGRRRQRQPRRWQSAAARPAARPAAVPRAASRPGCCSGSGWSAPRWRGAGARARADRRGHGSPRSGTGTGTGTGTGQA
jgi:hypothetical protein